MQNHCLTKLINLPCRYEEAVVDCSQSLNLDHTYIKAYFRRATARGKLGKLKDARKGTITTHLEATVGKQLIL